MILLLFLFSYLIPYAQCVKHLDRDDDDDDDDDDHDQTITVGDFVYKIDDHDEAELIDYTGTKSGDEIEIPEKIKNQNGKDVRVKDFSSKAFRGKTNIKSVTIKAQIDEIPEDSFNGCTGLTKVTLPDSVREIDERAFKGCTQLESINFPSRIHTIDIEAFYSTGLKGKIKLPSSLRTIGKRAFGNCPQITEFYIESDYTRASLLAGKVFTDKGVLYNDRELLQYPAANKNERYDIAESTETIQDGAFEGANNLKTLQIPKGMKNVDPNSLPANVKNMVYSGCPSSQPSSLTCVVIPEDCPNYKPPTGECQQIKPNQSNPGVNSPKGNKWLTIGIVIGVCVLVIIIVIIIVVVVLKKKKKHDRTTGDARPVESANVFAPKIVDEKSDEKKDKKASSSSSSSSSSSGGAAYNNQPLVYPPPVPNYPDPQAPSPYAGAYQPQDSQNLRDSNPYLGLPNNQTF
ncbi:hypothetical protein TRFO_31972 [Tritrichomonas foetus]|uniref:Surface antigen BspA-like n=1 Tax=Tritrichomonas foetus TaxID=1144522 RepID=A0A1J4JVH0_9EUKA|nr:hypothetical protein TRFO_31972 [Tritrichomonas foetus]|eukprot:OHT01261.1 hypothetical protein TRFO_31972 [Tritrichomonas foetus]